MSDGDGKAKVTGPGRWAISLGRPAPASRLGSPWEPGADSELLLAGIRLGVAALFVLVQVLPGRDPALRALLLPLSLVALALALGVYALAARRPGAWLGFVAGAIDVTLVTAALSVFLVAGPASLILATPAVFDAYFVVIGLGSLRHDWRVCLVTGGLAILEYGAVVSVAAAGWTGPAGVLAGLDGWTAPAARAVLLGAATAVSVLIVIRAQRLRRLSDTDRLTGTANRRAFEDRLSEEVSRAARYGRSLAVALVDLDHFKRVNDAHGHEVGDVVLQEVAGVIRRAIRESDMVARYGGEEFALILPEASAATVHARLERLREAVAALRVYLGRRRGQVRVTVSIGVASWPDDGGHMREVLAAADRRLYEAKRRGRDRVVGPDPGGRLAATAW